MTILVDIFLQIGYHKGGFPAGAQTARLPNDKRKVVSKMVDSCTFLVYFHPLICIPTTETGAVTIG